MPPQAYHLRGGFAAELHADATWPFLPHLKQVIARYLSEFFADSTNTRREFLVVVDFDKAEADSRGRGKKIVAGTYVSMH